LQSRRISYGEEKKRTQSAVLLDKSKRKKGKKGPKRNILRDGSGKKKRKGDALGRLTRGEKKRKSGCGN